MPASIMWFRRDLRLADNPALLAAHENGQEVLGVFVVDDRLWGASGAPRQARLAASLRRLDESLEGRLLVASGRPAAVLAGLARRLDAVSVHASADYGPYGRRRDRAVARALYDDAGSRLVLTGSPYAVAPGRLLNGRSQPYRVFTPYARAWADHGWLAPAPTPARPRWIEPDGDESATSRLDSLGADAVVDWAPDAGEHAASARWRTFCAEGLHGYREDRDRPDLDGTSRLSAALKWGELHPRTLLADLARAEGDGVGPGVAAFRTELAWREFYADVLHHRPDSARRSMREVFPEDAWTEGGTEAEALQAWAAGRTGYPIVDAAMRQLAATGWMHNRMRMVTASFLVKDLRVRWQRGAAHFMAHLVDGDLASNQHGWQWVAGTGTDAAPYFRVFNPVAQGRRHDPQGDYVRRWVPELRGIEGDAVHEPWTLASPPADYPARMVDHAAERRNSLAEHQRYRGSQ